MSNNISNVRGKDGEDIACKYIIYNNYELIKRNYHSIYGEIDIIAKKGDLLIFIEVKRRKNIDYGYACQSVNSKKIEKIIKTAQMYLAETIEYANSNCRFDVIEITGANLEIHHIKNAFEIT